MNEMALILMTTYNGEQYLRQQIESIINQTYEKWRLLIRDDGSSDDTNDILSYYENSDNRIEVLRNDTDSHGAYLNFWTIIRYARERYSEMDYYFFCDQDDIWENNKIEIMINHARTVSQEKPLLLYSDMRVIDQNNNVTYESLNDLMGIGEMSGYSLFFTHGFLWGCDICVNRVLFNTIPLISLNCPYIDIMSHDNYMGKYALLFGKIQYIDQVLINHRRHSYNTTGSYNMKLTIVDVFRKLGLGLKDLSRIHARVYNQTLVSIEYFKDNNGTDVSIAKQIEDAIKNGGFKMVRVMRRLKVKRKQSVRTLGIYFIALTNRYKRYLIIN